MHIRDLTKSPTSGVDEHLRGTFLGAAQTGTVNQYGQSTAFDYIKKIGYNYVQLQPIADRHKEYDEDGNVTYNWGYDPQNYNAPETSFSTNPDDPAQVIRDLKTMVQAYHDAGIGVIMDVVYNHTFSVVDAPFQTTVPDYYYRMNPDGTFQNGTGVGNETASEHEMFRKYMIDSLLYWVQEHNIDGFRFDLMGIHDVKTMQMIRQSLMKSTQHYPLWRRLGHGNRSCPLMIRLRKTTPTKCQILVSLMTISVMLSKVEKFTVQLNQVLSAVLRQSQFLPKQS